MPIATYHGGGLYRGAWPTGGGGGIGPDNPALTDGYFFLRAWDFLPRDALAGTANPPVFLNRIWGGNELKLLSFPASTGLLLTTTKTLKTTTTTTAVGAWGQTTLAAPENWDLGNIFAKIYWTKANGLTGKVCWNVNNGALSDNEALNQAFTAPGPYSPPYYSATYSTDNVVFETPEISLPPDFLAAPAAPSNLWVINLYRGPNPPGSDNMTGPVELIGVRIRYKKTVSVSSMTIAAIRTDTETRPPASEMPDSKPILESKKKKQSNESTKKINPKQVKTVKK